MKDHQFKIPFELLSQERVASPKLWS